MEKEKGNNPVEDKIQKKKKKVFKNNNSNQKDYTKLFNDLEINEIAISSICKPYIKYVLYMFCKLINVSI